MLSVERTLVRRVVETIMWLLVELPGPMARLRTNLISFSSFRIVENNPTVPLAIEVMDKPAFSSYLSDRQHWLLHP